MSISLLKNVPQRIVLLFVSGLIIGIPHIAHCDSVKQAQSVWIADPIFSTGYNSSSVHFELLETKTLIPKCKRVLSDMNPLPKTLTLYAKFVNDSTKIYIAGIADNEKILVLRNGICDAGIPLLSITHTHHKPQLNSDSPALSNDEAMELFKDTLARHEKAFGSKDAFLKWLDTSSERARSGCKGLSDLWCPPTYHTLQPELQEALKNYRNN